MLHLVELTVEAVQNGKKQFVNTYIKSPELNKAWINYIDAQTDFLYTAIETGDIVAKSMGVGLADAAVGKIFDPMINPWVKAGWDTWTTLNKKS